VSSPSLTRAVQKLEQELGGLLIRRERRLTHLTELGLRPMLEEVLAHAEGTKMHGGVPSAVWVAADAGISRGR
jgi:DNA-binding transcriptional LysR family regulator